MKTYYKHGKLSHTVYVMPGDTFKLTCSETDRDGTSRVIAQVSEDITKSMTITDYVMFYIKGVGFGGMFGETGLDERISEIFLDPVKLDSDQSLFDCGDLT